MGAEKTFSSMYVLMFSLSFMQPNCHEPSTLCLEYNGGVCVCGQVCMYAFLRLFKRIYFKVKVEINDYKLKHI